MRVVLSSAVLLCVSALAGGATTPLVDRVASLNTSNDAGGETLTSLAASPAASVTSSRPGELRGDDACRSFTEFVKGSLPVEVTYAFNSIAMLPDFIVVGVFNLIVPGSNFLTQAFLNCWRTTLTRQFGLDPTVATASLSGDVNADVYFSQTLEREGTPAVLAVVGRFSGLEPGRRYRLTLRNSGAGGCSAGDEYKKFRGATFTANADGKALLLLQDTSVLIDGPSSVLGHDVVVAPVGGGGTSFCGAVVPNTVEGFKKIKARNVDSL